MIKKIIAFFLIVLLIFVGYHYLNPAFEIKNAELKSLGYKVKPFKDSIYVYIPYEITIVNNRLTSLKMSRVFDENYREYRPNLIYNKDGIELFTLYGDSKKQYEDEPYWLKIQYSKVIFPFTKRTFYYYKKHQLGNKNDAFGIKNINKDSIRKQLIELKYNLNLNKNHKAIDSLYKANHLKIFNVDFATERFTRQKYIKTKINTDQQIIINLDYLDSIQDMTKMQKRAYLLKIARTNTKLDDF